jgi:hypothetical protein
MVKNPSKNPHRHGTISSSVKPCARKALLERQRLDWDDATWRRELEFVHVFGMKHEDQIPYEVNELTQRTGKIHHFVAG